ncbi:hypothetical protein N9N28_09965 [Rubripirellula amarantea]|nr:hypothetical protein [Rubripirellula amarantea]
MVQIEPPGTAEANGDVAAPIAPISPIAMGQSPVDSEAITEDGISGSLNSESDAEGLGIPSDGPAFAGGPPLPTDPNAVDQSLSGVPPTTLAWQSDRTRKTRQTVMVAMLAVSTLFITGLMFFWFVKSQSGVATMPDPSPVIETSPAIDETSADSVPTESSTQNSTASEEIAQANDLNVDEPGSMDQSQTSVQTPNQKTADQEMSDPEASDQTSGKPTEPTVVDTPASDSIIPSSLLPKSPLDGMPTSDQPLGLPAVKQDLLPSNQVPGKSDEGPEEGMLAELPAGLQQFTPLLLLDGLPQKPTLQAPPSIEQVQIDSAEEDEDELGMEPPPPIDVKADLAIRMAFRSNGYALPSFVLLISQTTGVPIQLDWVSFDLGGINIADPITTTGKVRTAKQWLEDIAAQVDGEIRPEATMVVLTMTDDAFATKKQPLLLLDDFNAGQVSAEKVIDDFMEEVNDAGGNRNVDGEVESADDVEAGDVEPAPAQLPLMTPRQSDQLRILATETLRRMRNIEGKVADDRIRRWTQLGAPSSDLWKELEGGKTIPQVDTPIAAAGFLRRSAQATGAVLMVNWHDANRRGMRPNRLVFPIARDDAANTLSSLLDEFSLQVRAVDQNHWWLGSPATYDRLPVIVGSEPMATEADARRFQLLMDQIMQNAGRDSYRITFDPESKRYLMLVPRYIARQLPKVGGAVAAN